MSDLSDILESNLSDARRTTALVLMSTQFIEHLVEADVIASNQQRAVQEAILVLVERKGKSKSKGEQVFSRPFLSEGIYRPRFARGRDLAADGRGLLASVGGGKGHNKGAEGMNRTALDDSLDAEPPGSSSSSSQASRARSRSR